MTYDARGRATSIVSPKGLTTSMAECRGWVNQPIEKAIDWAIEQAQVDEKDIAPELSAIKSR